MNKYSKQKLKERSKNTAGHPPLTTIYSFQLRPLGSLNVTTLFKSTIDV